MATKTQEPVIGDGSLHIGDRVVYPNQGICRITGVETKHIAGQNWEVVTLSREEDGATVMVPKAKVMGIGLRKVADVAAIDRVFDELSTPNLDPQLDWKVRHRENADRMSGGGLFGTVEVLKGLHALSRVRPLPQKERELYDNARHLLVGEIAAAMNIPLHVAEDNLDYALWPPEGMTRKGKALPPATLGPPSPARVASAEDDLGFEDEEMGEEETPAAEPAADEGEEEPEVAAPPAAKKAHTEKPKPAHKPEHAPARREKPAPAAAAKKAKPAHAPAKKPAAVKKVAARKPAAKAKAHKPAAKRPAAKKTKAKAKR
ncbi:MAG TPA: CarD family transcriptional regulator [Myxococcales bacterium]|jgi:RNA polymerase-interacting CarD/CdnL/TRCF family regulator|nr:CarD family transcriptional regulator [Myxococcales bacterium]